MPLELVNHDVINNLSLKLSRSLEGKNLSLCAAALLLTYCRGMPAVREYPDETRGARMSLVLSRGSLALMEIIKEVATISDEDVALEAAPPAGGVA